jgi:bifunctional DNase/RNase
MTHDLMLDTIGRLGSSLDAVQIVDVRGTTFYAKLLLTNANGARVEVDARPSDALALAVRAHVPIFADEGVIEAASMPNFDAVKRDEENRELERFRDFLKDVSPDDFKEQQRK